MKTSYGGNDLTRCDQEWKGLKTIRPLKKLWRYCSPQWTQWVMYLCNYVKHLPSAILGKDCTIWNKVDMCQLMN